MGEARQEGISILMCLAWHTSLLEDSRIVRVLTSYGCRRKGYMTASHKCFPTAYKCQLVVQLFEMSPREHLRGLTGAMRG